MTACSGLHRRLLLLLASAAMLLPAGARAEDGVPAPIGGISFDEWTSANARLARGQALADVLRTLGVTEAAWQQANEGFGKALQTADPGGALFKRYGEVFASPDAGRFAGATDSPKAARLRSFEDYARVQAEMAAAQEAGLDPVQVLKDRFDLTPFDYSQEGARWIQAMTDAATNDRPQMLRWQREQQRLLAEARQRYGARKAPTGG